MTLELLKEFELFTSSLLDGVAWSLMGSKNVLLFNLDGVCGGSDFDMLLLLSWFSVFSFCLKKLELLEGRLNWILTLYVGQEARFVLLARALRASASLAPLYFESTDSAVDCLLILLSVNCLAGLEGSLKRKEVFQ